ncbi:MAG: HK97-gp10 family putative phage morphogenesis protein [Bacillota bacterium]|nr:HK97-gp10 family putative phage morphogenesis protein [Bacillota bacterium]
MARVRRAKQRKVNVGIKGADKAIKLLEEMGAAASEVLEKATEAGGQIVLEDARTRCPEVTGALKASLHMEQAKSKKPEIKQEVKISPGKQEYYGTFVELGTTRQEAQPFLRPAVDKNKEQIGKAVNREILRALGRIR